MHHRTPVRLIVMSIVAAIALSGCYTVPITGRTAFVAVSEGEETSLGLQAFTDTKQKTPITKDAATSARIASIGKRIAAISEYPNWSWEFVVFDEPQTPNAWCLPGGKVGFYTGLLPYTKTDAEIATVMAHEIGHAVARHGGERMSEEMVVAAGATVIAGSVAPENVEKAKAAYGIGSQVFVALPHSRSQEYEADQIGLIYMARAGYDPREAVNFWERFSTVAAGQKPPEWLSTHPADENRIQKIKGLLPEALEEYKPAR
jgi:predicted Zn-dependent protease